MGLTTFRGGIHPPDSKRFTRDRKIRTAALPASVRLPLKQNAGRPPRLIVEKGQRVRTGEKIAEAAGALSVPLHASISGTVKRIERMPVPYRGKNLVVEIEGDGKDEMAWGADAADSPAPGGKEIIARIREAGVVGLGGAEFPTHYKLSPPPGKKLDTLIINAAECEPYLTVDYRLMIERGRDLIAGTRLLMTAAGVERAFIGIESNKSGARRALVEAAGERNAEPPPGSAAGKGDALPLRSGDAVPLGGGIFIVMLKTKYPQGAEKQLIKAILGREVPAQKGLPADVGVIVQNVGTAVAVFEACALGKPLYERVVTVTGAAVREPGNWLVRMGTSFAELVAQSGGLTDDAAMLIMGGPMMGIAQWTLDVPVVKGTTGILALTAREAARPARRACIHCGHCVQVCPMRLCPSLMRRAAEKGLWDEAEYYGVLECIECGACAYVCGTSRDLVQLYRHAKMEIQKRTCEVET